MTKIHKVLQGCPVIYCPSKHQSQDLGMPLSRPVKHFVFLSSILHPVMGLSNQEMEQWRFVLSKPTKLILTSMLLYRHIEMCKIYRLRHPYIIVKNIFDRVQVHRSQKLLGKGRQETYANDFPSNITGGATAENTQKRMWNCKHRRFKH